MKRRKDLFEAAIAGESIRECRRKRNLTMRDLSRMSGISASQINNIEKGKNNPTIATYIRLLNSMDYGFDIIDLTKDDWS